MEGRERGKSWGRSASIAAAVLSLAPAVARAVEDAPNVRLAHNPERFAVARALEGVARMVARPECQALLDEFADTTGRPLRAALEASGRNAPEHLAGVFFYDAPPTSAGRPRWP